MKVASLLIFAAAVAAANPTVYLIRHGEKPDDDNERGLSARGKQRAQCLRSVFGADSEYNIGKIMAQKYKSSGARRRPFDTVEPVATDLGLEVDVSCDRDDNDCVRDVVNNYDGPGNILLCWEHKMLNDIAESLGAQSVDEYPSEFDIIWTEPYPYSAVTNVTSENCPGLDN